MTDESYSFNYDGCQSGQTFMVKDVVDAFSSVLKNVPKIDFVNVKARGLEFCVMTKLRFLANFIPVLVSNDTVTCDYGGTTVTVPLSNVIAFFTHRDCLTSG